MIHDNMDMEEFLICDINLSTDEIVNEALVGTIHFPRIGDCKISVYGKEGKYPHFHIYSRANNFECCVCIFQSAYFSHGNKNGELTAKQKCILNDYLKSPKNNIKDLSIWKYAALGWNSTNPQQSRDIDKYKQSDYVTMTDTIKEAK